MLGTDPRRGDHAVRGTATLPHGTGKPVRVAVFAEGADADAARAAGATAAWPISDAKNQGMSLQLPSAAGANRRVFLAPAWEGPDSWQQPHICAR